jgi:hypothetical protein
MARKVSSRTVVNRKALDAIRGGLADGLALFGAAIIADTHPPDATPFGEGLVTTGDWGVWADTRKVGGTARKPRSVRLVKGALTLVVGYGFPGRFQERGTVHQPARPFFTPVVNRNLPNLPEHLRGPVQKAIDKAPDA